MTERDPTETDVVDRTDADDAEAGDPPADVVAEAERLTRLAREAVDDAEADAYRNERAALLAEYGYSARVRADDTRDVLVLYPKEWLEDGLVRVEQVEDTDRGIERPLSGPGEADDWAVVDAHNRRVAERVRDEYGPVHGENAAAFATFMSNHYARPLESATDGERAEFLTDYFPRNAWPSEKQRELIEESVALAVETGETTR